MKVGCSCTQSSNLKSDVMIFAYFEQFMERTKITVEHDVTVKALETRAKKDKPGLFSLFTLFPQNDLVVVKRQALLKRLSLSTWADLQITALHCKIKTVPSLPFPAK